MATYYETWIDRSETVRDQTSYTYYINSYYSMEKDAYEKILSAYPENGEFVKGKAADLIAVKENPLEKIEALRNVSMVVARGNVIMNPVVKKMKQVEALLDQYM